MRQTTDKDIVNLAKYMTIAVVVGCSFFVGWATYDVYLNYGAVSALGMFAVGFVGSLIPFTWVYGHYLIFKLVAE